MSDLEDRLRAELRAESQRTGPQHLRDLQAPEPGRRRGGTRRWLSPAAALVAVGLVATLIGVVAGDRLDSGPARSSPAASASASAGPSHPSPSVIPSSPAPSTTVPAAAPMPPFYVSTGPEQSTKIVIRDSATGAIIDDVTPLPDVPGVIPDDPNPVVVGLVAAAADEHTFVVSLHRQQVTASSETITWFYRLTLNPDGKPAALQKLPLTVQPGAGRYQAYAIALSPDGDTLAVAVGEDPQDQAREAATGHAAIEVVSLRTGATRTWTAPASTTLQDLSWATGTTLGFSSGSALPGASGNYQIRILDTAGPAGSLMSHSRPVVLDTSGPVESALLTDGGQTVVAFTRVPAGRSGSSVLAEFSAQTGQRLRVLATLRSDARVSSSGTVWSADPTGQWLLIGGVEGDSVGTPPRASDGQVFGRIDNGSFDPLPEQTALQPESGVW